MNRIGSSISQTIAGMQAQISGESDTRIEERVEEIGREIHELVKERTEDDDGADHRHIRRMDRVDRDGPEAGNAEEAFEQQRTREQPRDGERDVGDDRNQRVRQHVPRQNRRGRQPLRTRRQHVRLVDLVEDRGAEEPDVRSERREDTDGDGQDEIEPTFVAPHRKRAEPVGEEELSEQHPDDVVDAHQHRRADQDRLVGKASAPGGGHHREHQGEHRTADEDRDGERQRRTHPALQRLDHRLLHLERIAEVAGDESFHEVPELRVEETGKSVPGVPDDERLVIAPLVVERGDRFGRRVLAEDDFGGRTADDVEEDEREKEDPERRRDHLQRPLQRVLQHPHSFLRIATSASAFAASRRCSARTQRYAPEPLVS